jgi:hypothetical protein
MERIMPEPLGEVNRNIRELAARVDPQNDSSWEFVCECGDEGCTALVGLRLTQYDELKGAGRALLACGHRLRRTSTVGRDVEAGQQQEQQPEQKPQLVLFHSPRSGACRRLEGLLSQVLQHGRNHHTFNVIRVPVESQPELAARFSVDVVPTLIIVEARRVQARLETPKGARQLRQFLHPWLRPAANAPAV